MNRKFHNPFPILHLTGIFIKEHLREPTVLFWTLLSPALIFYGMSYTADRTATGSDHYLELSRWYYSYISLNVALFGFSYYLIGRRESGFIRSFVYTKKAQMKFLTSHTLSYLLLATLYCVAFYLITKPYAGPLDMAELVVITLRYGICYLLFSAVGVLFTLAPLKFQTAGTLFSIISFGSVISSLLSERRDAEWLAYAPFLNPLKLASNFISTGEVTITAATACVMTVIAGATLAMTSFRVNPVWSRY